MISKKNGIAECGYCLLGMMLLLNGCNRVGMEVETQDRSVFLGSLPHLFIQHNEPYISWIVQEDSMDWWLVQNLNTSEIDTIDGRLDWFVNWADFPKVFSGQNGMLALGLRYTSSGKYSYTIDYYTKTNDQKGWISHGSLPDDSTFTEHGFASAIAYHSGWLVVWLDGRNGEKGGFTGLRSAEVLTDGKVLKQQWVDTSVCDCCQTAIDVIGGIPQVVYRNRTKEEIRDIYTAKYNHGTWSEPEQIYEDNWTIAGCPVNGPQIVGYTDKGVVGWFTASHDKPQVKFSFTGGSIMEARILDSLTPLGRVRMSMIDDDGFAIAWMGNSENRTNLNLHLFDWDGVERKAWSIPQLSPSRVSGFPALSYLDQNIYLAWTSPGEKIDTVQLIRLPVYGIN